MKPETRELLRVWGRLMAVAYVFSAVVWASIFLIVVLILGVVWTVRWMS